MSIQNALRYILFLLVAVPATAQTSTWWYPLGNPGATRSDTTSTAHQNVNDLQIKWKTSALKNSSVVLIGGIRSRSGDNSQQVVGMTGDSLIILTSGGKLDLLKRYKDGSSPFSGSTDVKFTLTGLFNAASSSVDPIGKPNVIGVGVERSQIRSDVSGILALWGFLADSSGSIMKMLKIDMLDTANVSENQKAAVYPTAAYTPTGATGPIALAVVSQNQFIFHARDTLPSSPVDTMVNGLWKFDLASKSYPDPAGILWKYRVAPRAYPQTPALLSDPSVDETFVSLSTARYLFTKDIAIQPSLSSAEWTSSNGQYSVGLKANTKAWFDRIEYPTNRPSPDTLGEVHTYFARLYNPSTGDTTYRIITENHDQTRPGTAKINITKSEERSGFLARIQDASVKNAAWTIITADLDGTASGNDSVGLPNHHGDEIVGAFRRLDSNEIDTNQLIAFRFQPDSTIQLKDFARQRFSGRLMAAGDLVSDSTHRQEVMIANGDTLTILQMRDYHENEFRGGDNPTPFKTLRTLILDSRIISVAIADLEGDNDNDLIVCTEHSTYAIGKIQPQPFGIVTAEGTEFCEPDTIKVRWRRKVGGGEGGLIVTLKGNGDVIPLESNYMPTEDSYAVKTAGLKTGTYRLYLQDVDVPALIDSSTTFTIHAPSIAPFTIARKSYHVNDTISFSTMLQCLDSVRLQLRYEGGAWKNIPAHLSGSGDARTIVYIVECPTVAHCGDSLVRFQLRLVNTSGVVQSDPSAMLSIVIPPKRLALTPGDSSRSFARTVGWSETNFGCEQVTISYRAGKNTPWQTYGSFNTASQQASISIPMSVADSNIYVLVCCNDGSGTSCDYGLAEFIVNRTSDVNFVAPNPFNPNLPSSDYGNGAAIVYRLDQPGTVRVTIFDASRAVVTKLRNGEERQAGQTYVELWDGRNSRGEIVANGTYICVIESSSSERIVLPIIILKR